MAASDTDLERYLGHVSISIEMCLAGRELSEPRLASDGTCVAFVSRSAGASAIVVVPIGGGPERVVTTEPEPAAGRGQFGGCFDWLPDASAIVYAARDGDMWLQPMPGGVPRKITAVGPDRRIEAPCVAPDAAFVVAAIDQAEVWRWWIDGDRPPERLDDGSAGFVFDPYVTSCGTGVHWQAWDVPDMPWDASRVERVVLATGELGGHRPAAAIQQPRTTSDGTGIYVCDDGGWRNVWLDDGPLVVEPFEHAAPTWGMGQRSFAVSPDGGRVAFTRNEHGFGRLCVVEVATREVHAVARGVHNQLSWVGTTLTAMRSGARTPTQVVRYDTDSWERTTLAVGPVTAWDVIDLPEPELVEVAHDGVTLHARRYVAGRGRTLCWIHGGPTDQWQVEFMPRVAYWWSQGWDVLVPDPRGSSGHGRAYEQALRGEWGRLDVDDTAAIVRASHATGDSAPSRTVMVGSSSGGLAALGVVGRHRGLAAGAVVLYPVTDLAVLAAASHRFEAHYTLGLVGPLDDVVTYQERSPVKYAAEIDVPVLIMHGDADPVVPIESSVAFAEAMRAAAGDVELVVMAGEGHGFRDPANRRADFEHTARFLRRVVPDPDR